MDEAPAPAGYRSEESKRSYTNAVTWLGILFFIMQFAVPFVAMMVVLPTMFLSGAMNMAQNRIETTVLWQGEHWNLSRESGPGVSNPTTRLQRRGKDGKAVDVAAMADPDAKLLVGTDRLWILEEGRVRFLKSGAVEDYGGFETLGAHTAPFLHQGMPAVIERKGDGSYEVRVLEAKGWKKAGGIRMPAIAPGADFRELVRAVGVGPDLHLFRHDGLSLMHRVARPGEAAEGEDEWNAVGEASGAWHPFVYQGGPAVAAGGARNNMDGFVKVYVPKDGAWSVLMKVGLGLTPELAVNPIEGSDRFDVVVEGAMGGVTRYEVTPAGDIAAKRTAEEGFPMQRMMMIMFIIPQALSALLPLGFSFVLTGLMNRHRTSDHQGEQLASMAARGLASLLDYLLAFLPALPAMLGFIQAFGENGPNPREMTSMFFTFAVGMGGTFLVFLLFGVMEGTTGQTPGKWIAGIRVVGADDLQPCGVGRALLRKLLLIADGFFNGMVGLLVAGFNEKRQRVGDLVAKTVVVKRLPPRTNQTD